MLRPLAMQPITVFFPSHRTRDYVLSYVFVLNDRDPMTKAWDVLPPCAFTIGDNGHRSATRLFFIDLIRLNAVLLSALCKPSRDLFDWPTLTGTEDLGVLNTQWNGFHPRCRLNSPRVWIRHKYKKEDVLNCVRGRKESIHFAPQICFLQKVTLWARI